MAPHFLVVMVCSRIIMQLLPMKLASKIFAWLPDTPLVPALTRFKPHYTCMAHVTELTKFPAATTINVNSCIYSAWKNLMTYLRVVNSFMSDDILSHYRSTVICNKARLAITHIPASAFDTIGQHNTHEKNLVVFYSQRKEYREKWLVPVYCCLSSPRTHLVESK